MTTTPDPDAASDIEDRLRRTLRAEADRHPARPDLPAVRSTIEDGAGPAVVVDLRAAPRRTRARLLAAAAVLAVLAGGAVVAWSGPGREPIVADAPPAAATGWYLPGPGWTVEDLFVTGGISTPGQVRQVLLMPAAGADDETFPQMDVTVTRTSDPAAAIALVADREFDVWADDDGIRSREGSGGSAPSVDAVATVDDLVVRARSFGMAQADVVAYAAAWRESGGVALPTPEGMARVGDSTTPASPVPPDVAVDAAIGPQGLDGTATVGLEVRGPDGQEASYYLTRPGERRATATLPAAEARAAGLTEAELSVERPGLLADATVWEATGAVRGSTRFVIDAPGASIGVDGDGAADLVASLRPVTGDDWAAAVRDLPSDRVPLVLVPALADIRVTEADFMAPERAGTTVVASEPSAPTIEGPVTTVVSGPDQVDLLLARAGAEALADQVTVGFLGDTSADVVLTGDDRLDPARWYLPAERRGREGTSALDLAEAGGPAERPGPVDPTCAGPASDVTAPDLAVIRPVEVGSCVDWFAVVVRLDAEGRVTEVRARLGAP